MKAASVERKERKERQKERRRRSLCVRVQRERKRVENELGEIPAVSRLKDKRSHLNWYALNPANLTWVIKEAANKRKK